MKAVFLDFGTMGSGLDLKELESLVDELVVFDQSPDERLEFGLIGTPGAALPQ